jgi:hypothetical protein
MSFADRARLSVPVGRAPVAMFWLESGVPDFSK